MQLRAEQLQQHLTQPLAGLYVLHGDELLTIEAADAIRAAARKQGYDEREVLVVTSNFKWDELTLAAGNLSLFGGNKLIDLRIPSGKPGRDGGEALQKHAANLASGVVTLISLPELDWQTKKAAWLTALSNAGVVLELNSPTLPQLPDWIALRLARQKQNAPREALEFIATQVEGNLLAAHQEIQKLGLLYPEGALTLAQVEEAVLSVARYNVDGLRSALLAGDAERCARLLEGLRAEDTAPPLVLWAMASEARVLAGVRSALDRGLSMDTAFSNLKVFGPRQGPYRNAAQRISSAAARNALLHAARIDRMIKGLAHGDLWDEFLQLALRLTRQTPRGNA
ncbi:MAG TPA: DNA polymerase III subunit delta [Rhodocyclaceae bacterium]|jgi:DNA polymerase-3 subunit delta|nr:DNA polymerase III subunit delta [Rhodocyclaceae bacterium]